ncbi:MAG: hypothetical protein FJZ87_05815 [Chloroflexi bacterium]|nr:hypothetical protein [Chloroflexota bacterium]
MYLFQSPPFTNYDLRFTLAGIPVRVHPLFWLVAVFLGASSDLLQLPIWVLVVFLSILIHELGHALAFRYYGQRSQIVLHFAGGLTIPEPSPWGVATTSRSPGSLGQMFLSLAGPLAGFTFAALVVAGVTISGGLVLTNWLFGFIPLPLTTILPYGGRILNLLVSMLLWVNVFWGLINLMPVFPLDGGNVARSLFVHYDPVDGMRKSLWLSVVAGGLLALVGLIALRSVYMAILFGLLAFQSYQAIQGRY